MQTFLPFPDFQQSAAVLDRARLGKQRVEALQTLRALVIPEYGWQSHPAIRMWMGYVPALTLYGLTMVDEWTARGGEDTTREKIMEFAPQAAHPDYAAKIPMPPWLGNPGFPPQPPLPADRQGSAVLHGAVPGHGPGPGVRLARAQARAGAGGSCRGPHVGPAPAARATPSPKSWTLSACRRLAAARPPRRRRLPVRVRRFRLPPSRQGAQAARRSSSSRSPPASASSRKRRSPPFPATRSLPSRSTTARPSPSARSWAVRSPWRASFARNFKVDEIVDRSAFDYPALLQDPRVFFPIPAR